MGASFPPPINYGPQLAYKRNNIVAFGNLNGGGGVIANAANAADTTNNSFNTRTYKSAPLTSGGLTNFRLRFPGFNQTSGGVPETDIPTAVTYGAALEYPVGTFHLFYFKGQSTGVCAPGAAYLETDVLPYYVPPGATYAWKTWATWTPGSFIFSGGLSSTIPTLEWTNKGTNLANNTQTTTTFTSTQNGFGYAPILYASPMTRIPSVGIIGDSIGVGAGDTPDNLTYTTAWGRALRNRVGWINCSVGGSTMVSWLARFNGVYQLYLDSITDQIMELGVNDITAGQTLSQMQSNYQALIAPSLAAGIKVHGMTLMPHTTSTDHWTSASGQTVLATEGIRQGWNAWLRNWSAIGLSGLFDNDLVVDPAGSGKWSFDNNGGNPANGVATTVQAMLIPTLSGGAIASLASVVTQSGQSVGVGYPNNVTIPWAAIPYTGETGSGGAGTVTTNGSGQILASSAVITTPGSNYSYPPLICFAGPFTGDGLHPTIRGYNQLFSGGAFGPGAFSL